MLRGIILEHFFDARCYRRLGVLSIIGDETASLSPHGRPAPWVTHEHEQFGLVARPVFPLGLFQMPVLSGVQVDEIQLAIGSSLENFTTKPTCEYSQQCRGLMVNSCLRTHPRPKVPSCHRRPTPKDALVSVLV